MPKHNRTQLDIARDELMSHIHRCGVLKAAPEQQDHWLEETMEYMAERFTELTEDQLAELHQIGRRFCQPVISRVPTAEPESETGADSARDEMAGAA